ncbi:hypothetical protein TSUD_358740 [Trifolium subterraneum]|uniref:Reverse transcriptase domain-containing protein n=1 Tax=Trifolium subterraneum TaxID=3900 RepID=A0A2Z6NSM1_TRISU|nr:hypothetical protein TSUD_358740 [Trifolium subterraneum]
MLCCSLWGNDDCDWVSLPAAGSSGGILSIWRKSLGFIVFSFKGKRRLWNDILMTKNGFGDIVWCVVGDFNSVIEVTERRGVASDVLSHPSREMMEFRWFLEDLELVDMPLVGRQFTWFHQNGVAMSRLDRVLVSHDWARLWGNPNVWVDDRDVSDHCHLILRYDPADWGPKPFRFNNFWLENKHFTDLIVNTCESQNFTGWMGFILKERLKGLKLAIKRWSLEEYGKSEERKKMLVDSIKALDTKSEIVGISAEEVETRKCLFNDLYFHARVKSRRKSNSILALQTANGVTEGSTNVRQAAMSFFQQRYSNDEWARPNLDGVVFPMLSKENNSFLTAPFTLEEIERVVKDCDGSKCPGPDGFNFAFIKEFWELMKFEVRILFDQFHGNNCVPKCLMSYFLTLIPKVKSPQSLDDYRPISLLGCWYKLLAKVLASRLASVIGTLIPKTKSAFLKGRQLVEGVVAVNEVIDFAKKFRKDCVILKVGFEKACDSEDWGFLDYMLGRFEFSDKWRAWMKACVCEGNLFVLVNGIPTEEFQIKRGLKQGDLLAPLLFLLVATPFKYLGLPVGANPHKVSTWEPMLDVIRGRLGSWGNKYVSLGGRVVLLNAVLNAISIFFLSYWKMPVKVWRELVKIQRKFLWGGLSNHAKTGWVKWDDICRPKKEADLGLRNLLAKWRWKLLSHDHEVWKEIVTAKYDGDIIGKLAIGEVDVPRTASLWWQDICLLDVNGGWFRLAVGKKVGMGDSTSFWNEVWIGSQSLRQRFLRLYSVSTQQNEVIQSMGRMASGRWQWVLAWRQERKFGVFTFGICSLSPSVGTIRGVCVFKCLEECGAVQSLCVLLATAIGSDPNKG